MKSFHLTVRTPESEVISAEVNSIKVATEMGMMVVYPHHGSLTGSIPFSRFFVRKDNATTEIEYLMQKGLIFISVETNSVQILCYSCKELQDIEIRTAKEYLVMIEARLKEGKNLNDYQLKFLKNEKIAMVEQVNVLKQKQGK